MYSSDRKSVGDYVTLQRGSTYKGELVGKAGPPLLGLGSIEPGGGFRRGGFKTFGGDCPANWMVHPTGLYVALKGATKDGSMVGSVARLPHDLPAGRLTQDTARLDFKDPHPEVASYLYWVLRTPQYRDYCAGRVMGSASASFSREDFLSFPVPEPTVQSKKLVAILENIEEKVEANRRTSEALEHLASATFKAWFIDFEPVRAKGEGAKSFPGMPPAAFDALPKALIQSPVGSIPVGWEISSIGEMATIKGGSTPSTSIGRYWDGDYCWLTPKDLSNQQSPVVFDTDRKITEEGVKQTNSGLLPINTVLLSSRAPIGYLAISKIQLAINQGFIALIGDGPLPPHYIYQWVYHSLDEIKARASGSTFPEISKSAFRSIPLIMPPATIIQEFEDIAAAQFNLVTSLSHESKTLASLRDYLLPRLLSGQVRVRNE